MAKYLVCANYIGDGMKGLLHEGGSRRREQIMKLAGSLGGKVDCVYYAFGKYDIYGIFDMPDHISMAAFSLKAMASGLVSINSTLLISPEEIDEAANKTVDYRGPGENWMP